MSQKEEIGRGSEAALARAALLAGVLPVLVVHACYAISAKAGFIPACIPYLAGCTSISATGRHGVSWVIFKAGMIPAALVMIAYWTLCRRWLLGLGRPDAKAVRAMCALGIISALFLILYTIFLGSKGDFYNLMRRYGVTVHLSFGVLAQMLLTRELLLAAQGGALLRIARAQLGVLVALLAIGLASIPVGALMTDPGHARNMIEWNFAALMALYYVLTWRAARASAPAPSWGGFG